MNETRTRLMSAAVIEFASKGYAEANINRISETAGFAKGTVYNYFPSKQALMLALITKVGAFHLVFIGEQVRKDESAAGRLERFLAAGFEFVENHPAEARFLITTLYGADNEFKMAMYEAYLPMFRLVGEDIVTFGIRQGVFKESDPIRTAALLMTLYLGTSSNVDQGGKVWLKSSEVAQFALQALQKIE